MTERTRQPQPADGPERGVLDEAAMLVAGDPGASGRLRARHRSRPDGCCAGCGDTHVRWPCVHVSIADRADQLRHRRPERPAEPKR